MKTRTKFNFIVIFLLSIICCVIVFQVNSAKNNVYAIDTDDCINWDTSKSFLKDENYSFSGGDGTSENPYLINSQQDFATMVSNVNGGISYAGKYFRLEKNIKFYDDTIFNNKNYVRDLDSFSSIGDSEANYFAGNFNGNNKVISNIKIKSDSFSGLFGFIKGTTENRASVKNVSIQNFYLNYSADKPTMNVGVLAGKIEFCDITNCKIIAGNYDLIYNHKSNKAYIGGAVGAISSVGDSALTNVSCALNINITNSQSNNIEKSEIDDYSIIGGIVGDCGGQENTKISSSCFEGDITQTKTNDLALIVGGLVGRAKRTNISNCYSKGTLDFTTNVYVGGVVGLVNNEIIIDKCFVYLKDFNTNLQSNYNITIGQYNKVATNPIPKGVEINNFYCFSGQSKQINVKIINSSSDDLPSYIKSFEVTEITEEDFANQNTFNNFDFENIWNMGTTNPILKDYAQFKVELFANNGNANSVTIYLDNSTNVLDLENYNNQFKNGDYILLGWDKQSTAVTPEYSKLNDNLKITVSSNLKLYAIWQERYIVNIYHNNNSEAVTQFDITKQSPLKLQDVINLLSYENHFVIGFAREKTDLTPEFNANDVITINDITSSLDLYVLWKENYKVVLHFNSNATDVTLQFTDDNNSLNLQEYCTQEYAKQDCILLGWSKTNGKTIDYEKEDVITVNESFELYAIWQEIVVKVTENSITTMFADLTSAFNKIKTATSDVIIEIVRNITLDNDIEIEFDINVEILGKEKDVTINTNGFSFRIITRSAKDITINNLTFNNEKQVGGMLNYYSSGNMLLNNIYLTNNSSEEAILCSGNLTLKNCNIKSYNAEVVKVVNGELTIDGGEFESSKNIVNLGYNTYLNFANTAVLNSTQANVFIGQPNLETASIVLNANINNSISVKTQNVVSKNKYAIVNCNEYDYTKVSLIEPTDWHLVKINSIWYATDVYESYLNKNYLSKISVESSRIESITFTNNLPDLTNGVSVGSLNIAGEQDFVSNYGIIDVKCFSQTNDNNLIDLIIYSPATIYAPENSKSLFANLTSLKNISFDNLSFEKTTDVSNLFYNCCSIKELDLSAMNFSINKTTSNMLYGMNSLRMIFTPQDVNQSIINLPTNFNFYNIDDTSFENKILQIDTSALNCKLIVAFSLTLTVTDGVFEEDDTSFNYNQNKTIATKMIGYDEYKINSLPLPNKIGFDFVNWVDINSVNKNVDLPFEICADMQLTANFKAKEFKILYNANGGQGYIEDETVKYGQQVILSNGTEFSKTGYTLLNWETSSKQSYSLGYSFTYDILDNLELFAVYNPISYKVVFNSNNGENKKVSQNFVYDVQQNLKSNQFDYKGFRFKGWSLIENADLDSEIDFENEQLINQDNNLTSIQDEEINLYAVWVVKTDTDYRIKYYVQNQNLTDYDELLDLEEILSAPTNTKIEEENILIKDITGFEKAYIKYFKKDTQIDTAIVFGEEDLIIKVFYNRKIFTLNAIVSTSSNGGGTNGGVVSFNNLTDLVVTTTNVAYGLTQNLYFNVNEGYCIKNIESNNCNINLNDLSAYYVISDITDNVTINIEFELKRFNISLDNSNVNGTLSFVDGYFGEVYYGNNCLIKSTANNTYKFVNFVVKDTQNNTVLTSEDNPLAINNIKQDLVVSANFVKMYLLKINYASENGTITNLVSNDSLNINQNILSNQEYYIVENTNLSLLITPNKSYLHVNYVQINSVITQTIDNGDNSKTLNFEINCDTEIFVEIDIEKYVINFSSNIQNISTLTIKKDNVIDSTPTVTHGTMVTLQSVLNETGYQLTGWLVKENDNFRYLLDNNEQKITENSISFIADKNFEVVVEYKIEVSIRPSQNGVLNAKLLTEDNFVSDGIILALPNDKLQVNAVANYGYYLFNYTNEEFKVDEDSEESAKIENILLVTKPTIISAIFKSKQLEVELNYAENEGKVVTNFDNASKFVIGDEITLTANSEYGYKFKNWLVSYENANYNGIFNSIINPQTYVITADDVENGKLIICANFELITYKVYINSNNNNFVKINNSDVIENYYQLDSFSSINLSFYPKTNYKLSDLSLIDLEGTNKISLINNVINNSIKIQVEQDCVLNIEFKAITWLDDDIRAQSFNGGSGSQLDPFVISNARELALMSYLINNGQIDSESGLNYSKAYYKLKNGINLSGYFWIPIGIDEQGKRFNGVLDCRFYRITNAEVEDDSIETYYSNVFGCIENGKVININKSNTWLIVGITGSIVCLIGLVLVIIWKSKHKVKKKVFVLPNKYSNLSNISVESKFDEQAPTDKKINPIDFSRFNNKKK